ncbi:MAG: hypothetical protein KUF82_21030 [Candidatus Thiodiazotropha sp. (ex Ctena orbiculata)]|nr:hypothetical protein [Candidatus Thiodiazotropha taylori]
MKHTAAFILLILPFSASANAGIPMLALAWPVYWVALIPVILFEGYIAKNIIGLEIKESFSIAATSNFVSTLIGIPLAWAVMLLVEIGAAYIGQFIEYKGTIADIVTFPFMVAWLPPLDNIWLVYLAFVILAIPFCLVSIFIEAYTAKRMLKSVEMPIIFKWSRTSNLLSYSIIIIISAIYPYVLSIAA